MNIFKILFLTFFLGNIFSNKIDQHGAFFLKNSLSCEEVKLYIDSLEKNGYPMYLFNSQYNNEEEKKEYDKFHQIDLQDSIIAIFKNKTIEEYFATVTSFTAMVIAAVSLEDKAINEHYMEFLANCSGEEREQLKKKVEDILAFFLSHKARIDLLFGRRNDQFRRFFQTRFDRCAFRYDRPLMGILQELSLKEYIENSQSELLVMVAAAALLNDEVREAYARLLERGTDDQREELKKNIHQFLKKINCLREYFGNCLYPY